MVGVLACALGFLALSIVWNIVIYLLDRKPKGYQTKYEDGQWK